MESLKQEVLEANLALVEAGLVMRTFGNASAIDRASGMIVIKPSGVSYAAMQAGDMVVVDLDGKQVEGRLKPSVDTPIHIALYKAFKEVGGVAHTHSHFATCWAQAHRPIPCMGTTHADYFYGEIPVTAQLTEEEVAEDYERHIGESIVRTFDGTAPLQCPAALVADHGPFAWGRTVADAVEHAVVLEEVARLALHTLQLDPQHAFIKQHLLDKHFLRKHGDSAYYGQKG
ncbi:MAG: L-ribulose-5-phosphate 4-epimerase AraD [Candidatus Hydrogenedentes bacterium]|nr:L-ribulose-5-phosphate 4-epimerase AraD [Candidatus Hydrogenedentota bacterium]